MGFQRNVSSKDEVQSYVPGAQVGLSLLSLVMRTSLAQGLMKVFWILVCYWLSKTNNEKKMGKASIHSEMEFNFFLVTLRNVSSKIINLCY